MSHDYYQTHGRYLTGLAYRMLGSVDDAEEVTQETFLRYQSLGTPNLDRPRAWFTRVCTRICLDRMKRLSKKLEHYPGQWLPEPYVETAEPTALDESLSIALLVGLRQLTSQERAAFLLHDIFDYRFSEIAETLGLTSGHCRQLAVRARRKVRLARTSRKVATEDLKTITTAFLQAIHDGDADTLRNVLAADVKLQSDGGGKVAAVHYVLDGNHKVQVFLLRAFASLRKNASWQTRPKWFNGAPGFVIESPGHPASACQLQINDEGRISNVFIQRNPDKLKRLLN